MEGINVILKKFDISPKQKPFNSTKYSAYAEYVNSCISGEGEVGENAYLSLWDKEDIEELNDDYEVEEFLKDCILIGSDGGDTAYGIDKDGRFFSVPFIGMDDEEIVILGNNFTEFLSTLYNL